MSTTSKASKQTGGHRYLTVVEGVALANDFAGSRLTMSEFARQRGVSVQVIRYWSQRARQLAAASEPALVQVAEVSAAGGIELSSNLPALRGRTPGQPGSGDLPSRSSAVAILPAAIEVRLHDGICIAVRAGFSPEILSQVVSCLAVRPC